MNYIAILHKDDKSDYGVSFPDFPGCVTAGATLDEAKDMAKEALALALGLTVLNPLHPPHSHNLVAIAHKLRYVFTPHPFRHVLLHGIFPARIEQQPCRRDLSEMIDHGVENFPRPWWICDDVIRARIIANFKRVPRLHTPMLGHKVAHAAKISEEPP